MAKKINILFDATILANGEDKDPARSGIFFTAYNVLSELFKRDDCDVRLYCDPSRLFLLPTCFKKELAIFQNCPIVNMDQKDLFSKRYDMANYKRRKARKKKQSLRKVFYHYEKFFWSILKKLSALFEKPYTLNLDGIDCFLSPIFKVPLVITAKENIKKYVIIYDTTPFLFPENFSDVKDGESWFNALVASMNSGDHYFSISEASKNDFLKFVPILKQKQITVTPLAVAESFYNCPEKTMAALQKYNLPADKKYVFSQCSLEPRKNLIRAVKTFLDFIKKNKIDDLVFVLGGGAWKGFVERLEAEVPSYDKTKIIRAGYIDDEDLAPLYSGPQWFVYTSQYEGFGLPPLEAMKCGAPVITSNNSSLPEVVGDAGIMIDYDSDEQHIKAYEDYYFNPDLRQKMAAKGLARAKQFTWKNTVNSMIEVMKNEI